MHSHTKGFTFIEIIIMVATLGILLVMVAVGYGAWQRGTAITAVKGDLTQAVVGLRNFENFNNSYPPNLAGIKFEVSPHVAVALWTNAEGIPVYENLTPDQNVQLMLFACNAYMPVVDGGTTYNTACTVAGQNVHIKGQKSSNIVFHGPSVDLSDFELTCGPACDTAQQNIISIFEQQGGTWPLTVTGTSVPLPNPTNFAPTSNASKYCLQGISTAQPDIVYHATNTDKHLQEGPCPEDPELHYP